MNKKRKYEIILVILIAIVIFNITLLLTTHNEVTKSYNVTTVGSNNNGTVYKVVAGNTSSNNTIGIILGVHPREHEIHEAINQTLHNITTNETNNLNKKFVIYYVQTKDNITSRDDTRLAGEQLAHKFIVPNIKEDNPFIVVDVHEINPTYEYSYFIFSLSKRTDKVDSYVKEICNDVGLVDYKFSEGSSPKKVTKPIAKQGINTLLMEVSIDDTYAQKLQIANNFIRCLDKLEP